MGLGKRNKPIGQEKHFPPESSRGYKDYDYYYSYNPHKTDPLEGLNLDEEYILILEKKSGLPASTRKRIVEIKHNNALDFIFGIED